MSYELERMGDHAGQRRQAGPQARPAAAAQAPTSTCPRWPSSPRSSSTASCARSSTSTRTRPARVAAGDDEIDDLYHRTFDEVLDLMRADPDNVDRGARLLFAAHYLERIGDRVTNIAEDVVFLATGEIEDLNP